MLAGGGLLYWYLMKKQQPAVISTAVPAPAGATGGTPASASNPTSTATGQPSVSVSGTMPIGSSASTSSGTNVPPAVTQWANAGLGPNNLAQFNKMLPSMTSNELAQLNNIIANNLWGTPDAKTFWDAWRTKYHILDNTYVNFTDAGRVSDLLNYRMAG